LGLDVRANLHFFFQGHLAAQGCRQAVIFDGHPCLIGDQAQQLLATFIPVVARLTAEDVQATLDRVANQQRRAEKAYIRPQALAEPFVQEVFKGRDLNRQGSLRFENGLLSREGLGNLLHLSPNLLAVIEIRAMQLIQLDGTVGIEQNQGSAFGIGQLAGHKSRQLQDLVQVVKRAQSKSQPRQQILHPMVFSLQFCHPIRHCRGRHNGRLDLRQLSIIGRNGT
jgi:hypothetical protein